VVAIHQTGIYHAKAWAIALAAMAMFVGPKAKAGTSEDEKEIRALQDLFAKGIMTKDAKLRASIFAVDASLVPPTGGFFRGPEAMEKDFEQESASITDQTKASFANFRFRFITRDAAFVDADLTINNILGPDGKPIPVARVSVVFTAVRRGGKWLIQDERAHFVPMTPAGS
jgi:uncharacterized protein (TIGR02246 family)